MFSKFLGVIFFLFGLMLLGWVGYNLFVQRQPEFTGSPIRGLLFGGAAVVLGLNRMMGGNR